MNKVVKNQFQRVDDCNPVSIFDDEFQEKWIHKKVVKITGETEDDFIIEEKPVLVEKVNIRKQIQEEAKTTDLKELLRQFALTGDESIFNKRPGFYGDVSAIQKANEENGRVLTPEEVKSQLPEELQTLSVEQLATMKDEDIVAYFKKVRASVSEAKVEVKEGNNNE